MPTFHFELASPERLVFSGEVDQVDVPGSEGEFGVLAGHAPLVTTLRPGMLTVYQGGEKHQIVVHGGFAEAGPGGLTVLADMATSLKDLDRAAFAAQISEMEERVKQMEQGSLLDREIAKLDHYKALQGYMSATAMH
jgi:F-type H+-transporting ATPase subunit epsilon